MRDYVLTLLVAAAVTYMLTPLVRRLAARIGAMKEPRDRDVHVAPVPLIGGLAMYGGLVAGLLVAYQIRQLRDAFANTGMVTGLLLAGGLVVIIGIIDDRWGLSPLTKGAGQVAAGGILVATGTQLSWLPEPGGGAFVPTAVQATVLTIVVVVATINAVNFIDGLDGLAAGIVCIAAISFFAYYYSLTRVIDVSSLAAPALASAVLIGMCLGFLPHNFSPASVFMGDTGAMLLGLLLAYAPISSINSLDPAVLASQINRYPVVMPLVLPAALLVIPYADLLLAVTRRTRAGLSPFSPDRKHLHHRLLDIGHSQRASVLIMYLWAAMFSGIVVWLSIEKTVHPRAANHHGEPIFVFVAVTAAAVAALLLMSMPRLRWWQRSARRKRAGSGPVQAATGPASPAMTVTAAASSAPAKSATAVPATAGTSTVSSGLAPADPVEYVPAGAPATGLPDGHSGPAGPFAGAGSRSNGHRQPGSAPPAALQAEPAAVAEPAAGPDLAAEPEHNGRAARAAGSRPDQADRTPPDVTSPDIMRSWPPPPQGAARSVVGTIPPADLRPAEPVLSAEPGRWPAQPDPLPRRTPGGTSREVAWPDSSGGSLWQRPPARRAPAGSPSRGGHHRGQTAEGPAAPGAVGGGTPLSENGKSQIDWFGTASRGDG